MLPTILTCAASHSSPNPGSTARQLSKYHPSVPIFALSPVDVTINRLNLLWGTTPIRCPKVNTTEALVDLAESLLEQHGYVRSREVIAIVAGTRTKSGSTNFLRLHVMGEQNLEGVRFFAPHEDEANSAGWPTAKKTRAMPRPKFRCAPGRNLGAQMSMLRPAFCTRSET